MLYHKDILFSLFKLKYSLQEQNLYGLLYLYLVYASSVLDFVGVTSLSLYEVTYYTCCSVGFVCHRSHPNTYTKSHGITITSGSLVSNSAVTYSCP